MSDGANRVNRTVNDFDSPDDLAQALRSMEVKRSIHNGQYISFKAPELDETKNISAGANPGTEAQKLDTKLDWVLENYDQSISETQSLDDELQRLVVLKSYLLLDSERKEAFERVTGLASRIFNCPMALISLVDIGRQWFMSNRGLGDTRETPRKFAFCAHAIMAKEDFLIVPDATKDIRFKDNPLVTGPPDIRFYAGAPLISPEGYKLGTLCVLDRVARPGGITLEEKQNLMELAALAVQSCVDHKNNKMDEMNNPARMIAHTAHDLLTPLTGVQLSLSLLSEDEDFKSKLTSQQREMISTASNCTDMMGRICQTAIESFRKSRHQDPKIAKAPRTNPTSSIAPMAVSKLVKTLYTVLNPLPKKVPLVITVHPRVPEVIVTDELKVFRAAINFLTNACTKTETGAVQLSISPISDDGRDMLLLECEDTGPGVPVENYPYLFKPFDDPTEDSAANNCMKPTADGGFEAVSQMSVPDAGLGLYSVAVHVSSMAGEYGFRPRIAEKEILPGEKPVTGSIFWFKIPLIVPGSSETDGSGAGYPSASSDSFRERRLNMLGGEMNSLGVKVLSTPTLSYDIASKVHESFTRVLEGELSTQRADPTFDPGSTDTFTSVSSHGSDTRKYDTESMKMTEAVSLRNGETRTRKALVIEDSMVVRKSLTRVLTKLGFETAQAVDGMEGLKELQGALFDVVLCDFLMPVMDGLDCVQQYREWEANHRPFFHQHIVGISAHAGDEDIAKGIEAGMDDFRPKPVTYKQLVELDSSEKLKSISGVLDEIAAAGTLMIDAVGDSADDSGFENQSCEASNPTEDRESNTETQQRRKSDSSVHFCLVGIEQGKADIATLQSASSKMGWKIVVVHNGEEVLRLMKMRNWDLVLMDEDLPILQCSQCVARFREWEEKNRVNRQRNIVLLSASNLSTIVGSKSMVQLPYGFDVSLGKPIRLKEFEYLMATAERSESDFGVRDFVSR